MAGRGAGARAAGGGLAGGGGVGLARGGLLAGLLGGAPGGARARAGRGAAPRGRSQGRGAGTEAAPGPTASGAGGGLSASDSGFFAADAEWEGLGVHSVVADALRRAGLGRPTRVQAQAAPVVGRGRDSVVVAETGSGKTFSYLAPLASATLRAVASHEVRASSLVLCPNAALCSQVVRAARSLETKEGLPVVSVQQVSGGRGGGDGGLWTEIRPRSLPDLFVATPAGLLNALYAESSSPRLREQVLGGIARVVFDEADMLLDGGYRRQTEQLLLLLKLADRQDISRAAAAQLGLSEDEVGGLTRGEKKALWELASVDRQGGISDEGPGGESGGGGDGEASDTERLYTLLRDESKLLGKLEGLDLSRRQYVFVGATIPMAGKQSVGQKLKKAFPLAQWVRGQWHHCPGSFESSLEQRWVPVDDGPGAYRAIREALPGSSSSCGQGGLTMVFVKDARSAETLGNRLAHDGIEALVYHSKMALEEREAALGAFHDGGGARILVCTDAAARGVDIPGVSHVVQAHFASSAVDWLHRVGRTARAGRSGKVTNIYEPGQRELVEAVRAAAERGEPVEGAFSRKRSFRKKLRKSAREGQGGGGGGRGAPRPGGQARRARGRA